MEKIDLSKSSLYLFLISKFAIIGKCVLKQAIIQFCKFSFLTHPQNSLQCENTWQNYDWLNKRRDFMIMTTSFRITTPNSRIISINLCNFFTDKVKVKMNVIPPHFCLIFVHAKFSVILTPIVRQVGWPKSHIPPPNLNNN